MNNVKLIFKGWVEADDDELYTNVKKVCPKCGKKLSKTDALKYCGIIFVYCMDSKCRFAEVYEE